MLDIFATALLAYAAPAAEAVPTAFMPFLTACVSSGGQAGYRLPTPGQTGEASYAIWSPASTPSAPSMNRTISVNVWSDEPSQILVKINMLDANGTAKTLVVSSNSSHTTIARVAGLLVTSGNFTTAWCTRVTP